MKTNKQPREQALNRFSEPSYGSPQTAIMAKMGQALPRMAPEPLPMGPMRWPFGAAEVMAGKKKGKAKGKPRY